VATDSNTQDVAVLTVEAVQWAISDLQSQRIHPWFLAYLHLRQRSVEEGSSDDIEPHWEELGRYMRIRGGPPGKPFYRPLWNGKGSDPARFWMNPNLAGSYSPSSVRELVRKVVDTHSSHFELRPNHVEAAFKYLLNESRVSALALAAYLFRDYGFAADRPLDPMDLGAVLRQTFYFLPSDSDFATLFVEIVPPAVQHWFEPLSADTVGIE
jgi:hypothetical protein